MVVLILLSQLPFVYRRYKLGRLNAAILLLNSQRQLEANDEAFAEYKGVIHVHSSLGGHSTGSFDQIIAGANRNQLNFVVLTEHTSKNFNTAQMTLKGVHGGVLFINGNEVNTAASEHLLRIPGDETTVGASDPSAQEIISQGKATGSLMFVAYPAEFRSWDATGYDGLEVYNVYTDAR